MTNKKTTKNKPEERSCTGSACSALLSVGWIAKTAFSGPYFYTDRDDAELKLQDLHGCTEPEMHEVFMIKNR